MTNKTKGKNGHKPLKLLDLSFEGRAAVNTKPPRGKSRTRAPNCSNSVYARPHGGPRGTKSHPPSPYSFNKTPDYQQQLQADLHHMIVEENLMRSASPSWAIDVSSEPNHSGESPLFVHRLLAPSRLEQRSDFVPQPRSLFPSGRQRPLSANDAGRYRPNSTHLYLTTTELRSASSSEVDLRLGKPTRTTLLRARQKVNSAPQNAYEHRRELFKKAVEREETRRILTPSYSMQELIGLDLEEDETLHSFLIGARYNRAHFLDARSLENHGVYMPRGNPLGAFVVKQKHVEKNPEPPPAPPDTPVDDVDPFSTGVEDDPPPSPLPPPQPPSSPRPASPETPHPTPRTSTLETEQPPTPAWEEEVRTEADIKYPAQEGSQYGNHYAQKTEKKAQLGVMQQMLSLDDGLNVKGKALNNTAARPRSSLRPNSARSGSSAPYLSPRGLNPHLPMVMITGTAMSTNSSAGKGRKNTQPPASNQSQPSNHSAHNNHSAHSNSLMNGEMVGPVKVQMEDKSFNVPSIAGDTDAGEAAEADTDIEEDSLEDGEGREVFSSKKQRVQSAKGRHSRVRFADEVEVEDIPLEGNIEENHSSDGIVDESDHSPEGSLDGEHQSPEGLIDEEYNAPGGSTEVQKDQSPDVSTQHEAGDTTINGDNAAFFLTEEDGDKPQDDTDPRLDSLAMGDAARWRGENIGDDYQDDVPDEIDSVHEANKEEYEKEMGSFKDMDKYDDPSDIEPPEADPEKEDSEIVNDDKKIATEQAVSENTDPPVLEEDGHNVPDDDIFDELVETERSKSTEVDEERNNSMEGNNGVIISVDISSKHSDSDLGEQ